MVLCYIGLGSNLGDRQQYINSAVKKMKSLARTKVRKISSVIESEPQGGPVQGPYLNAVVEIETDLGPYQLLAELQNIESALGRVRAVVNGPRTIDLDILTYGDACIREEALCIPHPRILERNFVIVPLQEIAPHAIENIRKSLKPLKKVQKKVVRKVAKKTVTKVKRKKRTK
jgi:2-amino-4-hydroxy-6-hydroxymethyldihydropteridine diphosphokinase